MSHQSPDEPYNPPAFGTDIPIPIPTSMPTFLDVIVFGTSIPIPLSTTSHSTNSNSNNNNNSNNNSCLDRIIQYLDYCKNEEVQSDAAW